MMPVERLHIDELKRLEKQAGNVLRLWRRLQKDFADLQTRHAKLVLEHEKSADIHQQNLAARASEYQNALSALEEQWKTRYEAEVADGQQKLSSLRETHEDAVKALEIRHRQQLEDLQQELKQERAVKAALVARVRGVAHHE